jgi:hypothetical protein
MPRVVHCTTKIIGNFSAAQILLTMDIIDLSIMQLNQTLHIWILIFRN